MQELFPLGSMQQALSFNDIVFGQECHFLLLLKTVFDGQQPAMTFEIYICLLGMIIVLPCLS